MTLISQPIELLQKWLQRQLPESSWNWVSKKAAELGSGAHDRDFYLVVSLVPRKIGKSDLELTAQDLQQANAARAGWQPQDWSVDQAVRLVLILGATSNPAEFSRRLEQLFITADVGELITFYRGLPLYPDPERYVARAEEGLRTNMKAVFEAVAHHNPYPAEHFSEGTWNQMVLKALFVGSSLDPIRGLDARRNRKLAQTVIDYVHERWAASRTISPELWRMVGPFADKAMIDDLRKPLESNMLVERQAAGLALQECPRDEAKSLLNNVGDIKSDIDAGRVSWRIVCQNAPKP